MVAIDFFCGGGGTDENHDAGRRLRTFRSARGIHLAGGNALRFRFLRHRHALPSYPQCAVRPRRRAPRRYDGRGHSRMLETGGGCRVSRLRPDLRGRTSCPEG